MGASWLLVRTDLRRRWPTVAVLAVLIGLAGTFVLTAATGARRTDSALDRFLDATAMWDGSIEVAFPATDAVLADLAAEPEVAAATAAVGIPLVSEEIETGVISGLASGWLHDIYRPRMIAGRLPDPTRADEIIVNEDTAEKHHLAPGNVVVLEDFVGLGISQPMTIVGIHRGVIDLALADTYPGAIASEAFGRHFADQMYGTVVGTPLETLIRSRILATMRSDVTDPLPVLERVANRQVDARPRVAGRDEFVAPIERALAVQVEAFWILTAVTAVSALVLLGMAVARVAGSGVHPAGTLRSLGITSRSRTLITLAAPALAIVAGCVLAVVGAVAASPLVPLGSARLADPDSGVWVEPVTLIVGGVAFAVGLLVAAAALARIAVRPGRRGPRAPGRTLSLPLSAMLGRDLAYRGSSWGRLAVTATAVGLGLMVAASVYTASLDRLVDSPSLFGSDYEVVVFPDDSVEADQAFSAVDVDDPMIESAAIIQGGQLTVAGSLLEALVLDPVRGGMGGGTVLRGHAPLAYDEVALGPRTVDRLGLGVGEELTISSPFGSSMRIVGEAVLPLISAGTYGDVVWLTHAGADRLDVELGEPRMLVNFAKGFTGDDLYGFGDLSTSTIPVPDDVSNLMDVGPIPAVLAVFGGLLTTAVLIFALVGVVHRRTRDLSVLRALGLPARQIRRAMLTACLLIVGPGALIAVAAGVILGRTYWSVVASEVPALSRPVVPLAMVALGGLGALAAGCLIVIGPALLATRLHPAEILRRD